MSCWVVPTVAAEYWGISLDVVWRRVTDGLVPHKSDSGFLFVDVDPWTSHCSGAFRHAPPPTFVITAATPPTVESSYQTISTEPLLGQEPGAQTLSDPSDDPDEPVKPADELPELDEEESATFGRLSWEEVRQQVSRTRRAPAKLRA